MSKFSSDKGKKQMVGTKVRVRSSDLAHLLRKIERVLTTEDPSFKGLANAAGLEPKTDFRGIYLNNIPLADQDLSGFDFSGADLRNTGIERARYDKSTKFDLAIFDGPSLDPNVTAFNRRLRMLPYLRIEAELVKVITSGQRKYDVISFSTAIKKAPDANSAARWYEEMKRVGIVPNVFVFTSLIHKATSEDGARYWYDEMKKAGVTPNSVTFNVLLNKTEGEESAARWYDEMKNTGVAPDNFTFNALISKAETEESAAHWYDEMTKVGITPNVIVFTALINKAETEGRAAGWYTKMKIARVAPDVINFSALINKAENEESAAYWYDQMKKEKHPTGRGYPVYSDG